MGGTKSSETFVALSYPYCYEVFLCVGDDTLGVVPPNAGEETQGGGGQTISFTLMRES